jgi:hypothetical protein
MTLHNVLLFVFIGLNIMAAQNPANDAKAIEAARQTNVQQIEKALPDKSFDNWLRDLIGPGRKISWEVNDCGEQSGNPEVDKGSDFPMCVSALIDLGGKQRLDVMLVVGTFKTGVQTGPASFCLAAIHSPSGPLNFLKSLSQLPEAIKQIK